MARRGEEPPSCWDRALKLLGRQESSVRRLRRKLVQRGYGSEEIEEAIVRLKDYGYLDDHRYGARWAEERLRRGPIGARRLRSDLESRGLDGDVAASLVRDLLPENDLEMAREATESWNRRRGGDEKALARYLDRLGFSSGSIATLVMEARESRRESPQ